MGASIHKHKNKNLEHIFDFKADLDEYVPNWQNSTMMNVMYILSEEIKKDYVCQFDKNINIKINTVINNTICSLNDKINEIEQNNENDKNLLYLKQLILCLNGGLNFFL